MISLECRRGEARNKEQGDLLVGRIANGRVIHCTYSLLFILLSY